MDKDEIMTNCQNKINTMSSNSSTVKSIFVSLSIAIVVAYYGSSFFEQLFIPCKQRLFIVLVSIIFCFLELIANFVFTMFLINNLSIERGYIARYYYCGALKWNKNDYNHYSFVPFQYISKRKYLKAMKRSSLSDKWNQKFGNYKKLFVTYLSVFKIDVASLDDMELFNEYNNSYYIRKTKKTECFKSYSVYFFTIINVIIMLCIIALLLIRLYA